jgi:hypothetical protein
LRRGGCFAQASSGPSGGEYGRLWDSAIKNLDPVANAAALSSISTTYENDTSVRLTPSNLPPVAIDNSEPNRYVTLVIARFVHACWRKSVGTRIEEWACRSMNCNNVDAFP